MGLFPSLRIQPMRFYSSAILIILQNDFNGFSFFRGIHDAIPKLLARGI